MKAEYCGQIGLSTREEYRTIKLKVKGSSKLSKEEYQSMEYGQMVILSSTMSLSSREVIQRAV